MSAGGVRLQFAGTAAGHTASRSRATRSPATRAPSFQRGAGSLEDLGREDRAVAEACPAVAISVVDEATGRQLYP